MVWIISWEVYVDLAYKGNTSKHMILFWKVWWLFPFAIFYWPLDLAPTTFLPPLTFKDFSNVKYMNPASLKLKMLSNWLMTQMGGHINLV
jgi:hypothetical protein